MTVIASPAFTLRQVARVRTLHSLGVFNSAAYGKATAIRLGSRATALETSLGRASDDSLQPTLWLLQTSEKGEGSEIQLMSNQPKSTIQCICPPRTHISLTLVTEIKQGNAAYNLLGSQFPHVPL